MKEIYKGCGTLENRKEFASLILELQKINGGPTPLGYKVGNVIPLPEPKNTRLWEHLYHWSQMYLGLPNSQKILSIVHGNTKSERAESFEELCEDAKLHIAMFLYKYLWRKYSVEKDPETKLGTVISTARFGFQGWYNSSYNKIRSIVVLSSDLAEEPPVYPQGRKVGGSKSVIQ